MNRFLVLLFLLAFYPFQALGGSNHVVLITLDGFPAYLFNDPGAPIPTLRKLAKEGTVAEGVRVSNPAVTWPNHTTLITGVHPRKHSCLFNGVLVRPGTDMGVYVDSKRNHNDLIAVPTIFEQLHGYGIRSSAINWPCTRGLQILEDNFPDVPEQITHTTPRLRKELVELGALVDETDKSFMGLSAPARDQIWTAAACHAIKKRKPNLLLLHLLIMDGIHHKYGPQSPASYASAALLDAHVAEVLRALDEAGIRKQTTLFITADHGFETADKLILPNVAFRKAGLLEASSSPRILKARAQIVSEGGIAMVYLTNPATRQQDQEQVRTLLRDVEGIASIVTPQEFALLGMPDPASNPQMADLILEAKPGYGFANTATGEDIVIPIIPLTHNAGYHGYLSKTAKMNPLFISSGQRIKQGAKIGMIENVDIAPTAAFLLGHSLKNVEGRILKEILTEN